MKKKLLIILSLLLILSMVATACSPPQGGDTQPTDSSTTNGESKGEKILKTNNSSEPGSLDPPQEGTHESWILDHIFEGLMKVDSDLKIVPGMAEDYEVSMTI